MRDWRELLHRPVATGASPGDDDESPVPIEHVVVLMLENRSFDHMLGYLPHPDPAFDGLGTGRYANRDRQGREWATRPEARPFLPYGPDHSHEAVMHQLARGGLRRRPTNSGFVTSYERKAQGLDPPRFGGLLGPLVNAIVDLRGHAPVPVTDRGGLVMLCQPPDNVPVLGRLALEFAVCTRWFCSVPGETWPNRNFAHAATSDGETAIDIRPYTNRTIFEVLEEAGHDWHVYHDDTPQVWAFPALWNRPERHANWYPIDRFTEHVAAGRLPAYSFLEPNHRPPLHTLDHAPVIGSRDRSSSQHPENNLVADRDYDGFVLRTQGDFARGERLIATVYEALRANPDVFRRTVLLVTYDEHGGLYDHVPPPTGVPAPGERHGLARRIAHALLSRRTTPFDFTMLGPRVPAVVVSPYVPRGLVDDRVHDHASIPATLRRLFAPGAPPLTRRDAWSAPFHQLLRLAQPRTDLPDLSDHTAPVTAEAEPAASTPPAVAASGAAAVPDHYRPFVALADEVQEDLVEVGEPEAREASAPPATLAASLAVSRTFAAAADRHRAERPEPAMPAGPDAG